MDNILDMLYTLCRSVFKSQTEIRWRGGGGGKYEIGVGGKPIFSAPIIPHPDNRNVSKTLQVKDTHVQSGASLPKTFSFSSVEKVHFLTLNVFLSFLQRHTIPGMVHLGKPEKNKSSFFSGPATKMRGGG